MELMEVGMDIGPDQSVFLGALVDDADAELEQWSEMRSRLISSSKN